MAKTVDQLQLMLEELLGMRHVYFQPPASLQMSYPAIVYSRDDIQNIFANNGVYTQSHKYQLTVIDKDPDSVVVKRVSQLPTIRFERHFTKDNLNHDVFILHY